MQNEQREMRIPIGRSPSAILNFEACSSHFVIPSLVCGLVAAALMWTTLASARTPAISESLGDELLEDLAPGIFDAAPAGPRDERPAADPQDHGPGSPFGVPESLDHVGEDIGAASSAAPLPLVRARDGMQQARSLLALAGQRDSLSEARQAQEQVLAQLDELIEELSKKYPGDEGEADDQPAPDEQPLPEPGDSGAQAGRGTTAAADSTTRLKDAAAQPVEKMDRQELMQSLWGHLPEREREQLLRSFSDEFLPEYELEIEKYYRRLSEENNGSSPR